MLEDRVVPASLSYSTLIDGTVYASAVDSSGNIYVTGQAGSGFTTTPGAYLTTGSGPFVAKLNPSGSSVLYATYLGSAPGSGAGGGIAIDAAGDAYVIGAGSNIATTQNALASSESGSDPNLNDFIAELNPTGSGLLYATYLPGAVSTPVFGFDEDAIAVDASGNIYAAGAAQAGLPVTANAFQTSYLDASEGGGGSNAFFAKIDPALSGTASLLYASYLGGSGISGDAASAIALDSSGNAYVYGATTSSNFPTTSGAFERTYGGGTYGDAFVAKFNPALSGSVSLVFSTYLGGSNGYGDGFVSDQPGVLNTDNPTGGIAVDSTGNIYVTGSTTSTNFPTTQGAYQTTSNIVKSSNNAPEPPSDVFVTKLNPTGSALVYSTYLGGGGGKSSGGTYSGGCGIAVDASGNAYVTGWTDSTTFPTVNPIQARINSGTVKYNYERPMDSFVTVLNPTGSGLLFSTYLGGSSWDWGFSIGLDSANNAYVAGETDSSNFPTTAGAYDRTSGNGFVYKIDPPVGGSTAVPAIASISSGTAASGAQTMTNTGSPQVQKSNGQPSPSPADQPFTLIGNNPGSSASQTVLSSLLSEWQSLESALLARFDSLLSLEAGAMGMSKDALIRDLLFASEFLPASP